MNKPTIMMCWVVAIALMGGLMSGCEVCSVTLLEPSLMKQWLEGAGLALAAVAVTMAMWLLCQKANGW